MTGRRYLDFLSGIAVCNLGHAPQERRRGPGQRRHKKLLHISNLFYTEAQIRAAELLVEHSFGDKVFFCNSGAEANEAAIKLARRYSWKNHGEGRSEIIAMENSFHGRTHRDLVARRARRSSTSDSARCVDGFTFVPFNDLAAVEKSDLGADLRRHPRVYPVGGRGLRRGQGVPEEAAGS